MKFLWEEDYGQTLGRVGKWLHSDALRRARLVIQRHWRSDFP